MKFGTARLLPPRTSGRINRRLDSICNHRRPQIHLQSPSAAFMQDATRSSYWEQTPPSESKTDAPSSSRYPNNFFIAIIASSCCAGRGRTKRHAPHTRRTAATRITSFLNELNSRRRRRLIPCPPTSPSTDVSRPYIRASTANAAIWFSK